MHKLLVDTASSEFLFCLDFWEDESVFKELFGPVVAVVEADLTTQLQVLPGFACRLHRRGVWLCVEVDVGVCGGVGDGMGWRGESRPSTWMHAARLCSRSCLGRWWQWWRQTSPHTCR